MRTVEGFVCTARFTNPRHELLFGPQRNPIVPYSHENFTTNGLIPFDNLKSAQDALQEFRAKRKRLGAAHSGIAEIKMEIFTDDEVESLPEKGKYIIVAEGDFGHYELLGRRIEGLPGKGHVAVAELVVNGFKVIPKLRWVGFELFGALYEVRRQLRPVSSSLATFEMKRIRR